MNLPFFWDSGSRRKPAGDVKASALAVKGASLEGNKCLSLSDPIPETEDKMILCRIRA